MILIFKDKKLFTQHHLVATQQILRYLMDILHDGRQVPWSFQLTVMLTRLVIHLIGSLLLPIWWSFWVILLLLGLLRSSLL